MDVDETEHQPDQEVLQIPDFLPAPTTSGRQRRFPRHYVDFLPNFSTQVPHMPPKPSIRRDPMPFQQDVEKSPTPPDIPESSVMTTEPDEFGLYRVYTSYPSSNPDEFQDLADRCDAPGLSRALKSHTPKWWVGFGCNVTELTQRAHTNVFAPILNATVFRLMSWFYSGSSAKSIAELQSLVDDVLLAPDFDLSDLKDFSARRELRRLDGVANAEDEPGQLEGCNHGWRTGIIKITLPCENICQKEAEAPVLEVPGVFYRSLVEVITTALEDEASKSFHYTPFSLFWKPATNSLPQRVYSEIYQSDAFIKEDQKVKHLPPDPGPQYEHEHAIVALLLYSDSTHLAQFGTTSLWPVYAFFGNQSKYDRAKPSQFAAHHIAYLPSVGKHLYHTFPLLTNYLASK